MPDYPIDRSSYHNDRHWKQKGTSLLNSVQDIDQELKVANRNTKILISSLPISLSFVVLPGIYTFFALNPIVILLLIGSIAFLGAHVMLLVDNLAKTGRTLYRSSLPHKLEMARRSYHEWLEADAEPKPIKPEPKLVSTEVMPAKSGMIISSRKIQDLETESVDLVDNTGRVKTVKKIYKEVYNFSCDTCKYAQRSISYFSINTLYMKHKKMGHKCSIVVEEL